MTSEELKAIKQVGAIAASMRAIIALLVVVVLGLAGGVVWVRGTESHFDSIDKATSADEARFSDHVRTNQTIINEWTAWRGQKDEIDTRLITLIGEFEKNQKMMADRLEKLGDRIPAAR